MLPHASTCSILPFDQTIQKSLKQLLQVKKLSFLNVKAFAACACFIVDDVLCWKYVTSAWSSATLATKPQCLKEGCWCAQPGERVMPELMPIFMDTLSEGHCTDQKWEECYETLHHSVFLILNLNCISWSQRLIRLYWSKIRKYSDNDRNVDARWSTCPWRCLHWIGGIDQRYHQGTHCRTHCKTQHFYDFFDICTYDSICNILCVWLDILSLRETLFWTMFVFEYHYWLMKCDGIWELFCARIGQDLLTAYLDQLIPAIQQAIIDDDDSVRNQASTAPWLKMAIHNFLHKPANPEVKDIIRYPRHVSSKET